MSDSFLFARVATFSLIGYCSMIALPLYVDPKLYSHVAYGARDRPSNSWRWWLGGPIVFLLPLLMLRWFTSEGALLACSTAPLVVAVVIAAFSFPPERPHAGIVGTGFGFAVIILLTVVGRFTANDFSFVNQTGVPFEARLERLKAVVVLWQTISIYAGAGYLAFLVTWLYVNWVGAEKTVSGAKDRFVLGNWMATIMVMATACVLFGPLFEFFRNTFEATAQFSKLRK